MKSDNKEIHNIDKVGQVQIADEVVAVIAGLAASEIEGVACLTGNLTGDIVEIIGKKSLSKGVEVSITDNEVVVVIALVVEFGVKIPEVAKKVQEKVKNLIETMTGLVVKEVNVNVTAVHFKKTKNNDKK